MLDEVLEYKEYLWDPSHFVRLGKNKYLFTKNKNGNYKYSGIERALIIVARFFLTKNEYFVKNLGLPETNDQEYIKKKLAIVEDACHKLKAWMNDDIINGYARENDKEYPGFSDSLVVKMNGWSRKACNLYRIEDKANNTYKTITFEKIVAEAANIGPLQRYYLVCKKSILEENTFSKYVTPSSDKKKKLHLPKGQLIQVKIGTYEHDDQSTIDIDRILHIVAYYLLRQKQTGETEKDTYVEGNITDLSNWNGFNYHKGDLAVTGFYYGKKAICSTKSYNNTTKIMVSASFIDKFDFKLVEADEFDSSALGEDYIYFSDKGAGERLQINVKYFD